MKKSNKNHLPHKNAPKNSIKKAKEIVRKVTRKGKRATYTLEDHIRIKRSKNSCRQ